MKKIITFLFPILFFSSCEDALQEVPLDRLSQENFYKTNDDFTGATNAIYAQFKVDGVYGIWLPAFLTGMSDYAISRGTQAPVSEYKGLDGTNIGRSDLIWRGLYQVINSSNIVIKLAPTSTMIATDQNAFIGEARFLRALAYYHLVRNFGTVPIYTQPLESLASLGAKRSPVDEVYKLITDDLIFAETNLPNKVSQIGRPTIWAAKTLLSDVYLTRENWTAARDKANEVIRSGLYNLVEVKASDDFEKVYGAEIATSTEEIFALKYARITGQRWNYVAFLHPADAPFSVGGVRAHFTNFNIPLIKNWNDKDLRKDYNIYSRYVNRSNATITFPAAEPLCFRKYRDIVSNFHGNDVPVLRLSDALLIHAEASSQANKVPDAAALESLNRVRRRAYGFAQNTASTIDYTLQGQTAESFRELVLNERAYEFMMEFKRWYDLKRLGTDRLKAIIKIAKCKDVQDIHLLFAIPNQELDNNPALKPTDQNPGY